MVVGHYIQKHCRTVDAGMVHRHILRIYYGIIKLNLMSNGVLDAMEWCSRTFFIRLCNNVQTEGGPRQTRGPHHPQGRPEKRQSTNMRPILAYFENGHNQEDRLVEGRSAKIVT